MREGPSLRSLVEESRTSNQSSDLESQRTARAMCVNSVWASLATPNVKYDIYCERVTLISR